MILIYNLHLSSLWLTLVLSLFMASSKTDEKNKLYHFTIKSFLLLRKQSIMGKPKPSWIGVKEVRDSKAGEVILKSKVFPPGTWSRDKHEEKCPSGCEKHAQCYTQVIINFT